MGSNDAYWPPKKYDPFVPYKVPGPQRPLFPPQISGGNLVDKAPGSCCSTPGFEGYTLPVPAWVTAEQALGYSACILSGLLLSPGWSNLSEVIWKIEQSQDWLDCMAQATTKITLAAAPCCLYTPSQADFAAAGVAGFKRPIYATFFAFIDSAPGPGAPGSKVVKPLGDKLVYVGHFQPDPDILECATFYEQYAKVAPDKFQPVAGFANGASYWWPDFYGDWVAQHAIPLKYTGKHVDCPPGAIWAPWSEQCEVIQPQTCGVTCAQQDPAGLSWEQRAECALEALWNIISNYDTSIESLATEYIQKAEAAGSFDVPHGVLSIYGGHHGNLQPFYSPDWNQAQMAANKLPGSPLVLYVSIGEPAWFPGLYEETQLPCYSYPNDTNGYCVEPLYIYSEAAMDCVAAYWDLVAGFPDPYPINNWRWTQWASTCAAGPGCPRNGIQFVYYGNFALEFKPNHSPGF